MAIERIKGGNDMAEVKPFVDAPASMEQNASKKKRSQWLQVWKRLKRNKAAMVGLVILLILMFTAIFADFIAPDGIDDQDFNRRFEGQSKTHLMGTDHLGRDIFSRVV